MFTSLLLTASLASGQPPANVYYPRTSYPVVAQPAPAAQPPAALPMTQPPAAAPGKADDPGPAPDAPAEEAKKEEPEAIGIMKLLEGTRTGDFLAEKRISISGWTEFQYNASSAANNNSPVVWNDRANKFLLNQVWLRLEKATDTESKEMSFGYRVDTVYGSDYRFTLQRGLFNSQLESSRGNQNLYGVDLIQFYANAYLPNLFQGTDVRAGRLFTPFGYESLEGVSTPFASRSYAFNWAPPFTHMGIQVAPTFSDNWAGKFMVANGNDVWFVPEQELRGVAALTYTSDDKDTTATFGTSFGRGIFNAGSPFNPATVGLQTEPAGRNNINVFDFVLTKKINDKWNYAFESIYGYQQRVPANVAGGIIKENATEGTAHWYSIVNYLTYAVSDTVSAVNRLEFFDDAQGQRTGFEGLYTAYTFGLQWRPTPWAIIRPEVRYDHNNYSRPFEGKDDIFTATFDVVLRF